MSRTNHDSIRDRLFDYNNALNEASISHTSAMGNVAVAHHEDLTAPMEQRTFEKRIAQTGTDVDRETKSTTDKVGVIIYDLGHMSMLGLLSRTDREIFNEAMEGVRHYGVGSQSVGSKVRGASSHEAQDAMKAALDHPRWKETQDAVRTYGVGSQSVGSKVRGASSHEAQDAMKAALDHPRWKETQDAVRTYGVGSQSVGSKVRGASSHEAQDAMKAALDHPRWKETQDAVRTYGVGSQSVGSKVRGASSHDIGDKMKSFLPKPEPRQQRTYEYGNVDDIFAGMPDIDDILRDAGLKSDGIFDRIFNRNKQTDFEKQLRENRKRVEEEIRQTQERTRRAQEQAARDRESTNRIWEEARQQQARERAQQQARQGQQPPRQPRQESPRAEVSPKVAKAQGIVQQVTASDRNFGWLKSTDIMEVVKVINTVENARQKAEEAGETLADKQMYMRYRRRLETDAENEQYDLSFKIIDALMGGSHKGTLPF